MLDKLRSMAVFARVVESGSFRRAAERLELSPSVVSHHVTQLESQLGAKLLYRSTRHVALTDQGERFYQSCRSMLDAAESALEGLHDEQQSVVGKLWVQAPAPFSAGPFITDVAEFSRQYPRVELRIDFDDKPRNLIQEGIDVAIRFGPQVSSSLIVRTLFATRPGLFAAPAYLAECGGIADVAALREADWIGLIFTQEVVLYGPAGEVERFEPRRRITVNSVVAQHELALAGRGVIELPGVLAREDLAAGRLVPLLPDWTSGETPCCVLYPARATPNALSRRFVDFLHVRMQAMQALMAEQ